MLPAGHHQTQATQEAEVIPLFGARQTLEPRQIQSANAFELARIVGPIGVRAPELADDLIDAIGVWLEVRGVLPAASRLGVELGLQARRERLLACLELLDLSPYEPDPRD